MKKRGLGRGLDVLLSQTKLNAQTESEKDSVEATSDNLVKLIAVDLLVRGEYQPRRFFSQESLELLAESIAAQGIIQPLIVRPIEKEGRKCYEILAGERRWRAAQLAKLDHVPAIIREMSDQSALAVALIENIQREDLNPIEAAAAIQRLISEFELTHQEAGQLIGRSRSAISNSLRLLELAPAVQNMLFEEKLDMGHARALLSLTHSQQEEVAYLIVVRGLTVREAENLVKNYGKTTVEKKKIAYDPDIKRLETDLSEYLGAKVGFKNRGNGKGQMSISYDSLDQLDGILNKIKS